MNLRKIPIMNILLIGITINIIVNPTYIMVSALGIVLAYIGIRSWNSQRKQEDLVTQALNELRDGVERLSLQVGTTCKANSDEINNWKVQIEQLQIATNFKQFGSKK